MPIVENEVCNQRYQNSSADTTNQIIQDDMLCARSEGQDSCQVGPQAHPSSGSSQPAKLHCRGVWRCSLRAAFPTG